MVAASDPRTPTARATRSAGHVLFGIGAVAAGVIGALGASFAGLWYEARSASSVISKAALAAAERRGSADEARQFHWQDAPPNGDGIYLPDGSGPHPTSPDPAVTLTMIGDSLSVGYGCLTAAELPGVGLATVAATILDRPVRLTTRGQAGAITADLRTQLPAAIADRPDVVAIIVGANDVRHQVPPGRSVRQLAHAVTRLRAHGIEVIVATCPDLGVIMPIRQPLRHMVGSWSLTLARYQERAVLRAGGIPVSLSQLVSPAFYTHPDMFYADHFHPSGLGYAEAVTALTPAVVATLRAQASRRSQAEFVGETGADLGEPPI